MIGRTLGCVVVCGWLIASGSLQAHHSLAGVFTTGSATTLAERGIGKSSNVLKPGDTITAKFIPARNGNPLGFLKSITTADGRVINISNGNPND